MDQNEPSPRRSTNWLVLIGSVLFLFIAAALVWLAVWFTTPIFTRARTPIQPPACVNTLRQIDGAKEQWTLENKKTAGTPLARADIAQINEYIKGGATPPCPQGGTYSYNALDTKPTCTIPGHTI